MLSRNHRHSTQTFSASTTMTPISNPRDHGTSLNLLRENVPDGVRHTSRILTFLNHQPNNRKGLDRRSQMREDHRHLTTPISTSASKSDGQSQQTLPLTTQLVDPLTLLSRMFPWKKPLRGGVRVLGATVDHGVGAQTSIFCNDSSQNILEQRPHNKMTQSSSGRCHLGGVWAPPESEPYFCHHRLICILQYASVTHLIPFLWIIQCCRMLDTVTLLVSCS